MWPSLARHIHRLKTDYPVFGASKRVVTAVGHHVRGRVQEIARRFRNPDGSTSEHSEKPDDQD